MIGDKKRAEKKKTDPQLQLTMLQFNNVSICPFYNGKTSLSSSSLASSLSLNQP